MCWMVFHGYEKDHYNMGRQTLLLPVEWTSDGWYRIPDGATADQPVKRPRGAISATGFSLTDSFGSGALRPQWQFFGEYDTARFSSIDSGVVIQAKGRSVGDCSPLLCIPSDHSYLAQVEMFIEGEATGGLVLFYNSTAHSGILADRENIIADLRG